MTTLTAEHFFFVAISLVVAGLVWKLWHYRGAIIRLQADMTLVLNELTRPLPAKRFLTCNQCTTVLTPEEFAHHRCRRVTERAEAMTGAQLRDGWSNQ